LRADPINFSRGRLAAGIGACLLLIAAPSAAAQTGGATSPGSEPSTSTTTPAPAPTTFKTVPGNRAKLKKKNGKAIPPAGAPPAIQNAIIAANKIRKRPYRYGGGHGSFYDTGYDCSGAVSYLLYAAGLLEAPMPSGSFVNWGDPGKGKWVTTFANGGHMYAVIAGLRWDTSAYNSGGGKGPRWRAKKRPPKGFSVRHYPGM
jgi:cell wall-associated NlpC family hydrolase